MEEAQEGLLHSDLVAASIQERTSMVKVVRSTDLEIRQTRRCEPSLSALTFFASCFLSSVL